MLLELLGLVSTAVGDLTNVDQWFIRLGAALLARQLLPLQIARCQGINDTYINATCHGDLPGVGLGVFFDTMGPAFPLMVALIFLPASYILSGNLAIPLTLMVFIGSLMGTELPAPFNFLGAFVVAIGVGVAIFLGIHRLRRES